MSPLLYIYILKKLIYNMNFFPLFLHYLYFEIINLIFKELVQINDQLIRKEIILNKIFVIIKIYI